MNFKAMRVSGMLVRGVTMIIAIAFVGALEARAQTADLSGEWIFSVTTGESGTTMPVVTLEQDGETLRGSYSSDTLGDSPISGSVSGSEMTFSFSADAGGQLVDVVYSGTMDEEGKISGTMDIAGGFVTGTFTAERVEA